MLISSPPTSKTSPPASQPRDIRSAGGHVHSRAGACPPRGQDRPGRRAGVPAGALGQPPRPVCGCGVQTAPTRCGGRRARVVVIGETLPRCSTSTQRHRRRTDRHNRPPCHVAEARFHLAPVAPSAVWGYAYGRPSPATWTQDEISISIELSRVSSGSGSPVTTGQPRRCAQWTTCAATISPRG